MTTAFTSLAALGFTITFTFVAFVTLAAGTAALSSFDFFEFLPGSWSY
jgi:hypothetical protein